MMKPEHTISENGYTIEIHRDDSPREIEEALGDVTLFAWHRRYRFGGEPPAWATEAMGEGKLHEAIRERHPKAVIVPLFMYEHSGIAFSTGRGYPFNCPWDSGQLGVLFTDELPTRWDEKAQGWLPAANEVERQQGTMKLIQAVVEEMNNLASGNVWGYVVRNPEGDEIDSCWGYVGSDRDDGLLSAARDAVAFDRQRRESGERLVAESFAL